MTNHPPGLQDRWFITNYVVAALDEPEQAEKAMEALRHAGFPSEDMEHLPGEEAASQIDTSGEHSGRIKQITRAVWSYISIQANILRELEKDAQSGSRILAIQVQNREEAELASEILQAHNAHNIQQFGPYGEVIQSAP